MSDNTWRGELRFTQAARRHRIGKASTRHVMASTEPGLVTTSSGTAAWRYVGADERGRELEIIAIHIDQADGEASYLLVIHVMPTHLRK